MFRHGYIPLSLEDQAVIDEKIRQDALGMPVCKCSNCDSMGAKELMNNQKKMTIENFERTVSGLNGSLSEEDIILNLETSSHGRFQGPIRTESLDNDLIPDPQLPIMFDCPTLDDIRKDEAMKELFNLFCQRFETIFQHRFGAASDQMACQLLPPEKIWLLTKNFSQLLNGLHIRMIIGSEPILGTYDMIYRTINDWKTSQIYRVNEERIKEEVRCWLKEKRRKLARSQKRKETAARNKSQRAGGILTPQPKKRKASQNKSSQNSKRTSHDLGGASSIPKDPRIDPSLFDLDRNTSPHPAYRGPSQTSNIGRPEFEASDPRAELSKPQEPNFDVKDFHLHILMIDRVILTCF